MKRPAQPEEVAPAFGLFASFGLQTPGSWRLQVGGLVRKPGSDYTSGTGGLNAGSAGAAGAAARGARSCVSSRLYFFNLL